MADNTSSPSPSKWISTATTRIETLLFEEGCPITADQRESIFRIICSEVPVHTSTRSPDPEKVRAIKGRLADNFRELGGDEWRTQYAADIRTLLATLDARGDVWEKAIEVARKVEQSIASGEEYNEFHGLIVDVVEALEAARAKEQGK